MIENITIPAFKCVCDVCHYPWVSTNKKTPEFCPNRDCRSREWNGVKDRKTNVGTRIAVPKPVKVRVQEDEF